MDSKLRAFVGTTILQIRLTRQEALQPLLILLLLSLLSLFSFLFLLELLLLLFP
jgi:hypothetical protein